MTPENIRQEMINGPFAKEIAPFLIQVFKDEEPFATKLAFRQGMLTPDAADAIFRILNDTSRIKKLTPHREILAKAISENLDFLPTAKRKYWEVIVNFLATYEEDLTNIMDMAIADGILSESKKASIFVDDETATQSRLQELNWNIDVDSIQQASKYEELTKER